MRTAIKKLVSRIIAFVTREVIRELERHDRPAKQDAPGDAQPPMSVDVIRVLRDLSSREGNLALQNFFVGNHRFVAMLTEKNRRAAVDTYDYVDQAMPQTLFTPNQMQVIRGRREDILRTNGHILDLGVYKGGSTRELARIFPDQVIHGFDSFEGLPEDWAHAAKGAFGDVKGNLPEMPANVRLYPGWFSDTLPLWLQEHQSSPISLLRIDCDIYSSTKTIFQVLKPLIVNGTWIVFDELIGYRGFRHHELKAFNEFISDTGFEYDFVAFGLTHTILYLRNGQD